MNTLSIAGINIKTAIRTILIILLITISLMLTGCSKTAAIIFQEPVCGADHRTYSDATAAMRAGVDSIPGKCLEPAKSCGCGK